MKVTLEESFLPLESIFIFSLTGQRLETCFYFNHTSIYFNLNLFDFNFEKGMIASFLF